MSLPLRSLLLTFDELTPESINTNRGTVTLNQHYRFCPGWQSITGKQPLPSEDFQHVKRIVVGDNPTLGDNTGQGDADADYPQPVRCPKADAVSFLKQQLEERHSDSHTFWIHVVNTDAFCPDEASQFLEFARSQCGESTLLAVSAFGVPSIERTHPFDILVQEDILRAPAAIEHSEFASFHSQALTSSIDLLHTLCLHAAAGQSATMPASDDDVPAANDQPTDLRQIVMNPGKPWNRSISLEFPGGRGVRNQDFLYVAEVDDGDRSDMVLREALFVKPQDRWNVHDVSSEYLESTDLLRKHLGLK